MPNPKPTHLNTKSYVYVILKAIYQSLKVAKILLEKSFKLGLDDKIVWLEPNFILYLFTTYYFLEKQGYKKDMIWPHCS